MDALSTALERGFGCLFEHNALKACFVDPFEQNLGYNIPMTIAYGAILLVLAFYVLFPILDKRNVRFDDKFNRALIPFILWGASLRLVEVLGFVEREFNPLVPGFYFQTPGIWFLVAGVTLGALVLTRHFFKEKFADYFGATGALLLLLNLALIGSRFSQWDVLYSTILAFALVAALVAIAYSWALKQPWSNFLHSTFKPDALQSQSNILVVAGQLLDGTATAIAITYYGFSEQHVVSDLILNVHPFLFPLLKALLALAIVSYVDREIENNNLAGFIKMFLIVLGFATGGASLWKLAI